ncbi:MAG: hypothetical protein M1822_002883 [Bathelium mastoideum]|nr:MAG: hypothetical protein M1822_002883 [Bathelium mastoideum]
MSLPSHNYRAFAMLAIASNYFRRTVSQTLPSTIENVIPSCAQSCLATFISDGYPSSVCPDLSDVYCLCSHYDNGGFTLGEGALSCIKLSCPAPAANDLDNAYDICNAQSNHVTPTHQTLSVTAVLSAVATDTGSQSTGNPSATSTSSSSLSAASTSNTISPSRTSAPTFPAAVSSGAGPTETAAAVSSGSISKAQIAGVVVAVVALLVLVTGAAVLIGLRLRRKRIQSREGSVRSFGGNPPDPSTAEKGVRNEPIPYPPKAIKDPRKGHGGVGIARASQFRAAVAEQASDGSERDGVASGAIGIAISPTGYGEDTPLSGTSTGTTSQLLPEKPSLVRQQQQQQPTVKRPESNFSQATVFEEDSHTASQRVDSFVFPVPPSPVYSRFPQENPPARIATEMSSIPEKKRHTPLTIEIPPTAFKSKTATIAPPRIVAMSQPPVNTIMMPPKNKRRSRGFGQNGARNNEQYGKGSLSKPDDEARSQMQTQDQEFVPVTPQAKSTSGKHASNQTEIETERNSFASDTSFESIGDDPTPPEEATKRLSPVDESPISSIRYPKIPRSSNQVVPRRSPTGSQPPVTSSGSPQQRPWRLGASRLDDSTDSSESVSTLLAKRRGANAALEIERRLGLPPTITAASSSTDSMIPQTPKTASSSNTLGPTMVPWQPPGWRQSRFANALRTRATESNGGREVTWIDDSAISPTTVLRSPMWAPRLTPTRRGDDLMLSVS